MNQPARIWAWGMVVLIGAAACAQSAPATSPPGGESTEVEQPTQSESMAAPSESPSETATFTPEPLPAPRLPDPSGYDWVLVSDGFARPLLLTHAGDGSGRLFVVEQAGMIQVMENGAVHADPFLDLPTQVGSEGNEQGLLGLAFHPDFE